MEETKQPRTRRRGKQRGHGKKEGVSLDRFLSRGREYVSEKKLKREAREKAIMYSYKKQKRRTKDVMVHEEKSDAALSFYDSVFGKDGQGEEDAVNDDRDEQKSSRRKRKKEEKKDESVVVEADVEPKVGKNDPLLKAKWKARKTQDDYRLKKLEEERQARESLRKKEEGRKRRKHRGKDLVWKKTRKGQPIMANRMQRLLEKL